MFLKSNIIIVAIILLITAGLFGFLLFVDDHGLNNEKQDAPRNHVTTLSKKDKTAYKKVLASVFWAGEEKTTDNGFIHNYSSAWDTYWEEHYGGVDDPDNRCSYWPCEFTPNENPFYYALPYNDFDDRGKRKGSAIHIPWHYEAGEYESLLKNRWIEIMHKNKICYGQWEDVGPFESDDFEYVFGNEEPRNQEGLKAGLDVSPALEDCLGFSGSATLEWRFVKAKEVPDGPWTEIITTSGVSR